MKVRGPLPSRNVLADFSSTWSEAPATRRATAQPARTRGPVPPMRAPGGEAEILEIY